MAIRTPKPRINPKKDDRGDDGLTDEQLNLAQEKLFREAREQYDQ